MQNQGFQGQPVMQPNQGVMFQQQHVPGQGKKERILIEHIHSTHMANSKMVYNANPSLISSYESKLRL